MNKKLPLIYVDKLFDCFQTSKITHINSTFLFENLKNPCIFSKAYIMLYTCYLLMIQGLLKMKLLKFFSVLYLKVSQPKIDGHILMGFISRYKLPSLKQLNQFWAVRFHFFFVNSVSNFDAQFDIIFYKFCQCVPTLHQQKKTVWHVELKYERMFTQSPH